MRIDQKPGIRTKINLIFLAFEFLLLLSFIMPVYWIGRKTLEENAISHIRGLAVQKQLNLQGWLSYSERFIHGIALSSQLQDDLRYIYAAPLGSTYRQQLTGKLIQDLSVWTQTDNGFDALSVIDQDSGLVFASTDAREMGVDVSTAPFFLNGKRELSIHGPYLSGQLNVPALHVSLPVVISGSAPKAVLAVRINLNEMQYIVQRGIDPVNSLDAYLVNQSRAVIVPPRFLPDAAVLQDEIHTPAVDRCVQGQSGDLLGVDYRGVPSISSYFWLPDQQVCLVVELDQAVAFASLQKLQRLFIFSAVFALALGLPLSYGLSRMITRPVYRLLRQVERFSRGELQELIEVKTADEIGELSSAFNQMALNLSKSLLDSRVMALENLRLYEETKLRADQIERENALAEKFLDTSSSMILILDKEGQILRHNKVCESLLGRTYDEMHGKYYFDLIDGPNGRFEKIPTIEEIIAGGFPNFLDANFVTRAGDQWQSRWSCDALINSSGEIQFIICIGVDTTEMKNAEQALVEIKNHLEQTVEDRTRELRRSHQLLQAMLNAMPEVAALVDRDGKLINGNPTLFARLHTSMDELIGRDLFDFFPPDMAAERRALTAEVFATGQPKRYTESRSGQTIDNMLYPVYDDQGQVTAMAVLAIDVSNWMQAQETLAKQAGELERSNQDLERFAYIASHDLQEPLRMVTSFLQLLSRRYADQLDETANEYIWYAVDGATRMKEQINDLLAYSRVGTRGKQFQLIDLNMVLEVICRGLKIMIEENHAVVTSDPLPALTVDKTQIEQLFQNLIENAIKFHGSQPPQIHVGACRQEGGWVFSVSDNGIGIDAQYVDKVFELFHRLHTHDQYSGTGIGLAISKRIVERHGGRIWVESTPGQGSTFYFTLPENHKAG